MFFFEKTKEASSKACRRLLKSCRLVKKSFSFNSDPVFMGLSPKMDPRETVFSGFRGPGPGMMPMRG
ncbi:hypothetical protein CR164_07580 [Prosthecochloris marina]|uniref:Uncharacterized protein n=1 Tax=Prosthecochloris marina TaxID=2017681 RepID=A0A317T699_9CHLB|nr:hypothetical protein CR164_07580 [Prosthecochloris marina]